MKPGLQTEIGLVFLERFFYFHEQVFGREARQLINTIFVLSSASRNVALCFDVAPNFGGNIIQPEVGTLGGFCRVEADVYGSHIFGCYLFSTFGLLLAMNKAMGELLRRGKEGCGSIADIFILLNRPLVALMAHEMRHEMQYREPGKPLADLTDVRARCGEAWYREARTRWADRRQNYKPYQHGVEKDALVVEIVAEHALVTAPEDQKNKLIVAAIKN